SVDANAPGPFLSHIDTHDSLAVRREDNRRLLWVRTVNSANRCFHSQDRSILRSRQCAATKSLFGLFALFVLEFDVFRSRFNLVSRSAFLERREFCLFGGY